MRSIAISVVMLFTLTLAAQELPDAATLRKQVQEAAKNRKSIQYVAELTGEVTLDGKPVTEVVSAGRKIPVQSAVGKQTVAVQNPGKARVELDLGAGNLMVSDGEATWTYRPSTKLYTKITAAQGPDGVAANLAVLDVMGFFEDAKSAKTVRSEAIAVDGKNYDCWVITSSVKIPAGAAMGGTISDGVMTSWIDRKLSFAVQEVIAYSYKVAPAAGATPVEYHATLKQAMRSLRIDEPIAASVFAFVPPADAKEQPAQVAGRTDLTGTMAPTFKGVSLDGKAYSLDSLKGKPVLLDFWASWCGPCIRSMPTTEKLYADYQAQGFIVLGVDVDETRDTVEKFLKTKPLGYPVIMGSESGIPAAYGVTVFPTFVLIGADGKIAAHQFGFSETALSGIVSKVGLGAPAKAAN
ncbi:MAG TPA: redoxin family protein [Terriglobia bacterium]|nr:redoxin family protein [Terriglobia bacterium]